MLLPPPTAPPVSQSGRASGYPAAIHAATNARNNNEVEWNVVGIMARDQIIDHAG
jgi:hypothetical protein